MKRPVLPDSYDVWVDRSIHMLSTPGTSKYMTWLKKQHIFMFHYLSIILNKWWRLHKKYKKHNYLTQGPELGLKLLISLVQKVLEQSHKISWNKFSDFGCFTNPYMNWLLKFEAYYFTHLNNLNLQIITKDWNKSLVSTS